MLFLGNQEKYRLFNALMCLKRDNSVYYNNRQIIDEVINDTIKGQIDENKITKIFSTIQKESSELEQRCKAAVNRCLNIQKSIDEDTMNTDKQEEAMAEIIAIFEYYLKNKGLLKKMIHNQRNLNQSKFVR